jgi:hypothetical protein
VDALSWDDTVHQLFGIAARINTPGPGTTGAYLLTWEDGSSPLPNSTDGDFDLLRLQGEGQIEAYQMEHDVPNQNSGMHMTNGVSYRFVYIGKGYNFEARIYALPDTTTPVKRIFAVDRIGLFPDGTVGMIVADHPSDNPFHACWAVFGNFYVSAGVPELSLDASSGFAAVSWSASLDGIWVLESSPAIGAAAVWTEITADQIVFSSGQNLHTEGSTVDSNANTFFRLRKL